ncbi:MAG: DUF5615 family PIN-like protein [Halapricum sp.]
MPFCADEHVPDAVLTALESNGFEVVDAGAERGGETVDERLLAWCATHGYVLLTNDRDFVRLDATTNHAGVVCYTTQELTPGEFARGIRRLDRQFTPETMQNTLLWLENWLRR